jgi:hypothetical protein
VTMQRRCGVSVASDARVAAAAVAVTPSRPGPLSRRRTSRAARAIS